MGGRGDWKREGAARGLRDCVCACVDAGEGQR